MWILIYNVDGYEHNAQNKFGNSTMYIESLKAIQGQQTYKTSISRNVILQEAEAVASCSYEIDTNWGNEASIYIHLYISICVCT